MSFKEPNFIDLTKEKRHTSWSGRVSSREVRVCVVSKLAVELGKCLRVGFD